VGGNFCDWFGVLHLATDVIANLDGHLLVGLPPPLLDVPIATELKLAYVTALVAAAPAVALSD
jgi:hypothetical protein